MKGFLEACQTACGVPALYRGAALADFGGGLSVPDAPASISLMGPNRTGKTHLAAALCGLWASECFSCRFFSASEAVASIRAEGGHMNAHGEMQTVEVLVLDDITAVRENDYNLDLLFRLMNLRYSEQMPTVVTGNFGISQWKDKHGAIWKMLKDFHPIYLKEVWNG